jgi:hypothetical protein
MCNVASFTAAGATTAGGWLTAAGQLSSGIMSWQTGRENQAQFEYQAALREQKGKYDAEQARNKYDRTRGQAAVNMGTTGISLASFSDVMADSAMESALEIKAIRFQAQAEAENLRAQGRAKANEGRAAFIGSVFSAIGTGLNTRAKLASMGGGSGTGNVAYQPWNYQVSRYNG